MRTLTKTFLLSISCIVCLSSCMKDDGLPDIKVKGKCLLISDSTNAGGINSFSSYQFEGNTNRLKISKKVGNGTLTLYREIEYLQGDLPDRALTYLNGYEYYETRFSYKNGSPLPYKTELFYTDKRKTPASNSIWTFYFYYDSKKRTKEVVYTTPKAGDQEYTLHISYNNNDNVSKLEYEVTAGPRVPNTVINVKGFDNNPGPYTGIPYWQFLLLNATWDSNDPEPLISALSKNNPLDYSLGSFKREMTYEYNRNGMPIKRFNKIKVGNAEQRFQDSFIYKCP